ncbi:MAG: RluA family pseudouridine synthase [Ruminococcaceae bacterium]|nr:RluA family pseudouridine synthase [Oscillospiraceae bacterium]
MIDVLYEDEYLLVCLKPVGVLSQPDVTGSGENMLALLSEQLATRDGKTPYVGLVHRLDRGVGGVMVFAKRQDVAGALSAAVANRTLIKQYMAVVHGVPDEAGGVWKDFLYKDAAKNKTFVVDRLRKGVKEASLEYEVLATESDTPAGTCSLLRIRLHTGRTHQIRVQCSSRGMPLVGDGKYGARDHGLPIGLWSYRLTFAHPRKKGKEVDVCALPTEGAFLWFSATGEQGEG